MAESVSSYNLFCRSILSAMAKFASAGSPALAACQYPQDCAIMLITDSHNPGTIADIPVGTTPTISYFEEFKVDP